MFDIVIIGAGIVGAFIARELSKYHLSVALIEKNNDVGNGTTNANSAIIHSGYDPEPGTNKAKFNVLGNKMFDQIADELDVHFERNGSLTIATTEEQLQVLKTLEERAKINGVQVTLLNKEEVLKLEPNITPDVLGALLAPTCGIIDPFNLCVHAVENAIDNGVQLFLSNKVENIIKTDDGYKIVTNQREFTAKIVINAAGVYADKIAAMIEPIDFSITPRKGEYFVLDHLNGSFVNHVIYPVPTEKGKGVLAVPTVQVEIILLDRAVNQSKTKMMFLLIK